MVRVRKAAAFEAPVFHLAAYGLRNPVVTWCIERGIYNDLRCLTCKGTGRSRREPGREPYPCGSCQGSGWRRLAKIHSADTGDPESSRIAANLGVTAVPHQLTCAAGADWRQPCNCRPLGG